MCNTIGCPNFDSPPLCAECTLEIKELKAEVAEVEEANMALFEESQRLKAERKETKSPWSDKCIEAVNELEDKHEIEVVSIDHHGKWVDLCNEQESELATLKASKLDADANAQEWEAENKELKLKVSVLETSLINADVVMHKIDRAVIRTVLSSRSAISDARLCYGDPLEYKYASKEMLEALED
jgi:hypothetical protein